MSRGEVVDIRGEILRRTDKAILIKTEDGEEHWIPESVCEEVHSDKKTKGQDWLVVQKWFARKEGLS